jgi:hypothetical protein
MLVANAQKSLPSPERDEIFSIVLKTKPSVVCCSVQRSVARNSQVVNGISQ